MSNFALNTAGSLTAEVDGNAKRLLSGCRAKFTIVVSGYCVNVPKRKFMAGVCRGWHRMRMRNTGNRRQLHRKERRDERLEYESRDELAWIED